MSIANIFAMDHSSYLFTCWYVCLLWLVSHVKGMLFLHINYSHLVFCMCFAWSFTFSLLFWIISFLAGYCAYLDVENALDHCLAEAMGIDTENLLIVQPDSTENLLSVVDTLTKSGSIDVIVVDSVSDSFCS